MFKPQSDFTTASISPMGLPRTVNIESITLRAWQPLEDAPLLMTVPHGLSTTPQTELTKGSLQLGSSNPAVNVRSMLTLTMRWSPMPQPRNSESSQRIKIPSALTFQRFASFLELTFYMTWPHIAPTLTGMTSQSLPPPFWPLASPSTPPQMKFSVPQLQFMEADCLKS